MARQSASSWRTRTIDRRDVGAFLVHRQTGFTGRLQERFARRLDALASLKHVNAWLQGVSVFETPSGVRPVIDQKLRSLGGAGQGV